MQTPAYKGEGYVLLSIRQANAIVQQNARCRTHLQSYLRLIITYLFSRQNYITEGFVYSIGLIIIR